MEFGLGEGNFDIIIVNDNLDTAYDELKLFIAPDIRKLEPTGWYSCGHAVSHTINLFFC